MPTMKRSSGLVEAGADATRRSARLSQGSELTHPSVAFAFADLLDEIARIADSDRLDHVIRNAALRAARAISDVASHQQGMTRAMRCSCNRIIRTSASQVDNAPPIKCLACGDCFVVISVEDHTRGTAGSARRPRATDTRGTFERNP